MQFVADVGASLPAAGILNYCAINTIIVVSKIF